MSNGIDKRQNEKRSIEMLAAQRQIYKDAKKYACVVLGISLIIPFSVSVVMTFIPENQILSALSCILAVISIFLINTFNSSTKQKKELAAYIQLKFDVYVFQMPWDRRLFGEERNVNREIAQYSNDILSDDKEKQELENWYTKPASEKPILEGILVCQRENFSWDYELRRRIKRDGIALALILIVFILLVSVWNNELVITLLGRVLFIVPIVKWLIDLIFSINEDMKRLESLEKEININGNKSMEELQEIQRDIYIHRKECYVIPDLIYNWYKKKDETREQRIARM